MDFLKVCQLILHLLGVLAGSSFISVDLSDLVSVLGGAHLEWSVHQSALSNNLQGYTSFLEDRVERIRQSELVFALVCFDDPRSTFLSDLDRALEPLDRLVRDDAVIVFLTDWTVFDEVAFEVHLLVIEKANAPSKLGRLPRVI